MKKIFLSHREKHPQLRNFELVLRELIRIEPVLLEDCPKKGGMPPAELVKHYMRECQGILFLLTPDVQSGGVMHPSSSVCMEITISEELFPREKRFYLVEHGVTFPSMAAEPSYIPFSWNEILPALVDLHRALGEAELIDIPRPLNASTLGEVRTEHLFVLETVASGSDGWVYTSQASKSYQQRFGKDRADFSVLVDEMKRFNLVEESERLERDGDAAIRKVMILSPKSKGLQLLGKHRRDEREARANNLQAALQKMGLIQRASKK